MDYLEYTPEDFAADESYLRYYFRLDDADVAFWKNWIRNHPEKLDQIMNADHLIDMLAAVLPEAELYKEYDKLQEALLANDPVFENKNTQIKSAIFINNTRKRALNYLVIGCMLMLALVSGAVFLILKNTNGAYNIAESKTSLLHKVNTSGVAERLLLEDGTLVTLQPLSEIDYPQHFAQNKREVFINGESFFEVSKNASRPFYVYHNNVVTHVLGTSFNVKAFNNSNEMEVSVRTGKVEVYDTATSKDNKTVATKKENKIVLTVNEKVVYKKDKNVFETSIVNSPQQKIDEQIVLKDDVKSILDYTPPDNFLFDYETVGNIIKVLENNYGIKIVIEDVNIDNCHFSGDLSNMDFFKKLDVICKAINVLYEIQGTKIIIRGKGCN